MGMRASLVRLVRGLVFALTFCYINPKSSDHVSDILVIKQGVIFLSKEQKHWCDKKYIKKETNFDTGDLAHKIVNTLTEWTLHDMSITETMGKYQIMCMRKRMHDILKLSEKIECLVVDANSIYAIYNIDFEERRGKWLLARGYCFQLTVMFTHITEYVYKDINVQKYIDIENDVKRLAGKIKNIMIKDDKRRKENIKEY